MFNWPFTADATLDVQGVGFWLGIVGFAVTIIGFLLTWRKIANAKSVAESLKDQVLGIRVSLDRYDVSQEASKADAHLKYAQTHLKERSWSGLAASYTDFLRSLHIIRQLQVVEIEQFSENIQSTILYCEKLITRAELNVNNIMNDNDASKINSSTRSNEMLITSIKVALSRSIVQ